MNRSTRGLPGVWGVAVMLVLILAPVAALADTPSGADVLVPKPAEFIPAFVAFLIIWSVLAKCVWPSITSKMEMRQKKIEGDLDAAERSKVDAEEELEKNKAKIVEAQKQAEEIISKAKQEVEQERSQVLGKAQSEADDILAKAQSTVESERKKAMIELSGQVVDLSVEIAGKIIGNDLSETSQRKLAEKYLAEVSTSDVN